MAETRTYYAVSMFSSRTFWFAILTVLAGLLAQPEILAVIPLTWLPALLAAVGVGNAVLRTLTVRPVVFSAPGSVTPVVVQSLGPPPPPIVSD